MKLKAITAACALAFAGAANAAAPTPSQAAASTVQLFVSGSSALQLTIGQIANGLFNSGSLSVFFDGSGNGSSYRAYAGTFSAAAGATLSGKTGIIYETAKGGSIQGIVPVALKQTVGRLDLTTCPASATGTDSITGAPLYTCSNTPVNVVPDAGTGDVEPAMFVGINVPAGTPQATPSVISKLTTKSSLGQPMAIIVTNNFLTAGAGGTDALPNMSKAQVTALMQGAASGFFDWGTVGQAAGPVIVCRRTPGSGTQATINAKFFGFPCSSTSLPPDDHTATASGAYYVIENTSSGALAKCMGYAQNGTGGVAVDITTGALTTQTVEDATHVILPAGGRAIGLMGLDRPSQNATTEPYHFININGVTPSIANASTGNWDIMVENSWNQRAPADLTADQQTLFNDLVKNSGNPAILGSTTLPVPGVAGLTENGYIYNAATFATYPVMRVGDHSNTCQPLVQLQ